MEVPGAAEQRLSDALRARAVGGGYVPQEPTWNPPAQAVPDAPVAPQSRLRRQVAGALLVALLAGLALGVGIALVSMLVPGLLTPFG